MVNHLRFTNKKLLNECAKRRYVRVISENFTYGFIFSCSEWFIKQSPSTRLKSLWLLLWLPLYCLGYLKVNLLQKVLLLLLASFI